MNKFKLLLLVLAVTVLYCGCNQSSAGGVSSSQEVDLKESQAVSENDKENEDVVPATQKEENEYINVDSTSKGMYMDDSQKGKYYTDSDVPNSVRENIENNSIRVYTDPDTGNEYWLTEDEIKELEENGMSVKDTMINDPELYEKLGQVADEANQK